MYGKMQESGLTEIILSYAPQLSGADVLFSHPELLWGSLSQGVAAIWWLLDSRHSPSWVPLELTGSFWRAVTIDDGDILVYW